MKRDYLTGDEVEALVMQTRFVAPMCWGPRGIWIEGVNEKQVRRAKRFIERMRESNKETNNAED